MPMPPIHWLLHELGESDAFWRARTIVDPSIILSNWGLFSLRRLNTGSFPRAYISPTLARILAGGRDDSQRDLPYLFQQELGLDRRETKDSLERWRLDLTREETTEEESPRRFFTNIEEDGFHINIEEDGSDGARKPTEELEIYRRVLSWLRKNVAKEGYAKEGDLDKRLESSVEQIFIEQIALGAALSGEGAFVLARCASKPWFWSYLQKKGVIPCKEITEEDWLRDEVQEKKQWLRMRGIHQLAYAGFSFGFVHFVFPDPSLLKGLVASALSAGWALYVDP